MSRNPSVPLLLLSGSIFMQKFIPVLFFSMGTMLCGSPVHADESRAPNIVVILADDAGWGDFSCIGNKTISTPAVDSLARDGALLEQFFVPSIMTPPRAHNVLA